MFYHMLFFDQDADEMDWTGDYSGLIAPFTAPRSPDRAAAVFDYLLANPPFEDTAFGFCPNFLILMEAS